MTDGRRDRMHRMLCPDCQGTGQRQVTRAAKGGLGEAFTVVQPWPCETCDHMGWLDVAAASA